MHRIRIISGKYKRLFIQTVGEDTTRETTDKVRETMFNLIGQYFNDEIVLDLFAGSGALGLEALSRGVKKVYFVDCNQKAYTTVKKNLETLKIDNSQYEIFKNDYSKMLTYFKINRISFDIIFLDPPYHKISNDDILNEIARLELLNYGGTIVLEQLKDLEMTLPTGYNIIKRRNISIRDIVVIERNIQ